MELLRGFRSSAQTHRRLWQAMTSRGLFLRKQEPITTDVRGWTTATQTP